VRRKITAIDQHADHLAELELERYQRDQERIKRMKDRDEEIANEASHIRKAILQARQFVDEFS
jgi:hypothetical protein